MSRRFILYVLVLIAISSLLGCGSGSSSSNPMGSSLQSPSAQEGFIRANIGAPVVKRKLKKLPMEI